MAVTNEEFLGRNIDPVATGKRLEMMLKRDPFRLKR